MLTHFRWSKTHKRITRKIKSIDCNIAIDHTSAYYSFTLNLQTPGHHTNVIGLFNTIDAGVRVQESISNHITDLIVGAEESKNAPLSFTEQATHEECQGIYTILSAYAPSTPQD